MAEYIVCLKRINTTDFDDLVVASTTETTCEVTDLLAGANYEFTVKAKDAAGNISEPSAVLKVTTLQDLEPPSKPELMIENITDSSIAFSWQPSSDDVGIKGYEIQINFEPVDFITDNATTYTVSGLEPNEDYLVCVYAVDENFNYSKPADEIVTTKVSNIEQLKKTLIKNLNELNTTCTLTYTGDISKINTDIQNTIREAIHDSNEPFLLTDYSYNIIEDAGNQIITFTFEYDSKDYSRVYSTLEELKEYLLSEMIDRNENVNIIFKKEIREDDIQGILDENKNEDSYLRLCLNNSGYSISYSLERYGVSFTFNYETTREQEDYIDKTVDFIIFSLINGDRNEHEKVKLIHDYVLSKLIRSTDKTCRNAYDALYHGKATSEGYAMLTYKMLKAVGIDNIIVTNDEHAWNIVKIDNKWYHLDTAFDDGDRKDEGFYKYYNMTDEELLQTRPYTNITGITCTSDYINDLQNLNNEAGGKYDKLLREIQQKSGYVPINTFKSNNTLNLMYNEIVLKEGEVISLIDPNVPEGFYDNMYVWRSSDPDILEVSDGVIYTYKAGKAVIAAVQIFSFDSDHNLFATVEVVSEESETGATSQTVSQSNFIGFTDSDVVPQVIVSSNEDINETTTVTNCFDILNGKIEMIGQPVDIQSSSDFEWAEISFTLDDELLNSIDINDLVIYMYDDELGVIIPQTTMVDKWEGKVSATVTHFSKYFLSNGDLQNETINIAFVIDSYYSDQESLDIYKTNIINTVLELRKQANVKLVFVDDNEENSKEIQNLYVGMMENPNDISNFFVANSISSIFENIEPLGNPIEPGIIEEGSEAIKIGRDKLRDKNIISNIFGTEPKIYALVYTKRSVVFEENQSIVLDMGDTIGLVVGNIRGYYEDYPIAYNESNVQPLVKFFLRGDYSLIKTEATGKKSWEIRYGSENYTDDVMVLQKVLITKGYLSKDFSPFGTYDINTRDAVVIYQFMNRLAQTGIVDCNTWERLPLPWDEQNIIPDRNSYVYLNYLHQAIHHDKPASVVLQKIADGQTVKVGDTIRIITNGVNCEYIALFINDEFVNSQRGNNFEYSYTIPRRGNYYIYVMGSNIPLPYIPSEIAESNIEKVTATAKGVSYDRIKNIEELSPGYHELFVKELNSKVFVYITDPRREVIKFSIGTPDKHERVHEAASNSGMDPVVAINAGFFTMCEYYNRDYPELGKRKGEMRIDNNDVEHFGVLIGDCEELETVSMLRSIQIRDGKEVLEERDAYKDRVEQSNTFINWGKEDKEIKRITVDDIEDIKEMAEWAIGAGYTLIDMKSNIINDGKYYNPEDYIRMYGNNWYSPTIDWKPRTMLGVRASEQIILAVIEGGSNSSSNKGANAKEQALIMKQLGAVQAVNLDGGGSSAFWKSGEGYKYEAEGRRIGSVVMVVELR